MSLSRNSMKNAGDDHMKEVQELPDVSKLLSLIADRMADELQPRYLKLHDAPTYVGVTGGTFDKWRKQGLVDVIKIGGINRVDRYDLDRLMLEHKYGPHAGR